MVNYLSDLHTDASMVVWRYKELQRLGRRLRIHAHAKVRKPEYRLLHTHHVRQFQDSSKVGFKLLYVSTQHTFVSTAHIFTLNHRCSRIP